MSSVVLWQGSEWRESDRRVRPHTFVFCLCGRIRRFDSHHVPAKNITDSM